jgi:hypothetical protein
VAKLENVVDRKKLCLFRMAKDGKNVSIITNSLVAMPRGEGAAHHMLDTGRKW